MDTAAPGLEAVMATAELRRRADRRPDYEAENRALLSLARQLANSPTGFLQALSDCAMALCRAESAGVSILEEHAAGRLFRWHAVSGRFSPNIWGTMRRDASPCGIVIDSDATQLMIRPERAFAELRQAAPAISEALLVPFRTRGMPVGTLWVLLHDRTHGFDAEDARVLERLGEFASSAYEILSALHVNAAGGDVRAGQA